MNTTLPVIQKLYAGTNFKFEVELAHWIKHGYVFSEPDMFLMGGPISLAQGGTLVEPGCADAWFVGLAVGEGALKWFTRNMPYYLPSVAWYRNFKYKSDRRLHVWTTEKLIARINKKPLK